MVQTSTDSGKSLSDFSESSCSNEGTEPDRPGSSGAGRLASFDVRDATYYRNHAIFVAMGIRKIGEDNRSDLIRERGYINSLNRGHKWRDRCSTQSGEPPENTIHYGTASGYAAEKRPIMSLFRKLSKIFNGGIDKEILALHQTVRVIQSDVTRLKEHTGIDRALLELTEGKGQ